MTIKNTRPNASLFEILNEIKHYNGADIESSIEFIALAEASLNAKVSEGLAIRAALKVGYHVEQVTPQKLRFYIPKPSLFTKIKTIFKSKENKND